MLGHRSNQKTFFDEIVGYYLPDNHFLKVNDIIDWTPIEKRLETLYDPSKGRPSYPPLIMFKALLLQQWFNLSDRDLSEAIADRLSFKSFLGLSLVEGKDNKSDPDARWTVKRGKLSYGYKVHVNADESGIARRLEMTPANVHDSSKQ